MYWLHTRWPAGRVERLPEVGADFGTAVPGLYVVGDLAGVPLLKFSADSGAAAVATIVADPGFVQAQKGRSDPAVWDVVIVGAGVAGMAAALAAGKAGLRYLIVEATQRFSTVVNFPKGKPIFTYPKEMTPRGDLQFHGQVKEELLAELHAQSAGIAVESGRVERIERRDGQLYCQLAGGGEQRALRVIVAIGRSGDFRRLGVAGEQLDKVYNRLHDPKDYAGKRVLVVGGGDSAVETAIALAEAGAEVTLSYRQAELGRPKPESRERLAELAASGRVTLRLGSQVQEIRPTEVLLKQGGDPAVSLPNDIVFTMLGREAPLGFLRRAGIAIHGETSRLGWLGLIGLLLFCTFLYTWKSGGPTEHWLDPFPGNLADWLSHKWQDRATLLGTLAVSLKSRSFYYTLLYSSCIVVFGIQRIRRRQTPYVKLQTLTLISVQLLPLFLLPEIILPWLGYNGIFSQGAGKAIADRLFEPYIPDAQYLAAQWPSWGHPRAYWRAYGFILAWPLSVYNVFTDRPMGVWLGISIVQTFVLIPLLVYRYGKGAYCGWICSCGALAETLGDTQRSKMGHGPAWNRLNMVGQGVLLVATLLLLVRIVGWLLPGTIFDRHFSLLLDGKSQAGHLVNPLSYKWVVDILLGGILGVGLYFKYSGRMWCRIACPLAALMHIYARFSRFAILPEKKKCISCNVCTSVCHMGIDVMSFANKGQPMQDPECVRCSACVQQCPTGVLSFGTVDKTGQPSGRDRLPASLVQIRENPAARKLS